LPTPSVTGNTTVCVNDNDAYTTTNKVGDTYIWVVQGGTISSGAGTNSINVKWGTGSVGRVRVLEKAGSASCQDSSWLTIVINPQPAAATGPNKSICAGASTFIGTSSVTGNTYSWVSSPVGFTSTSSNPSVSPSTTTTYTLTETITATGCQKSNSVTITVNPLPAANAGLNKAICAGQSISIGSSAVLGSIYAWTPSTGLSSTTSSNPTASPSGTTTYKLIETNTNNCVDSHTVMVTVNPLPLAKVANDTTICAGSSVNIGSAATAGNTYSWSSSPAGFSSTLSNPSVSPLVTTTYTLAETVTATGCTKSNSVKVTVNPLPAANAGSNITICTGNSTVLGSTAMSGNSYSWSPATGLSPSTTVSNPTATPTSTTTYILTEKITATGCTKSNSVIVTVNPLPTPSVSGTTTVCINDNDTYTTTNNPGNNYTWVVQDGSIVSGAGTNSVIVKWGNGSLGRVRVLEKVGSTSCQDSSFLIININPLPTAKPGSPATICVNQGAAIGSSAISGDTYSWTSKPAGFTSTLSNPNVNPLTSTTYYLTEAISATSCKKTDSVKITVNALPVVSTGPADTFCNTSTTSTLSGSPNGGTWTGKGVTSSGVFTPSSAGVGIFNLYYHYNDPVTGCTDSAKHIVNVVNPANVITGNNDTVCINAADYSLTGFSPSGGAWTGTGVTSGGVFSASKSGTGTFTLTYTVGKNTCKVSGSKIVKVNPLPTVSAGTNEVICISVSPYVLTGQTPAGGKWTGTGVSSTGTFSPAVAGAGTFTLSYSFTDPVTHCLNSGTKTIKVNPLPVVSTSPDDTFCNTGTTVTLTGSPAGGTWKGKGVTSSGVFTPTSAGVGIFTLYYVYSDPATGCIDSAKHIVNVVSPSNVVAGPNDTVCIDAADYSFKNYSPLGGNWSGTDITSSGVFSPSKAGTGVFNFTYTVGKNTCKVSANKSVKINPLPVVKAGSPEKLCLNDPNLSISGFSPSGGIWTGSGIIDKTKGIFSAKSAGTGSHRLTYTYTDPLTHCTSFDTVSYSVLTMPDHILSNDTFQCINVAANFSSNSTNTSIYKWDFGDTTVGSGSNPQHVYKNTGKYTIRLISVTPGGCSDTIFSSIRISEPPVANFSRTPYSGPGPLTVSFKNLSSGEIFGYKWNYGNKDSTTKQLPDTMIYQQSDNGDTTYYITLTVHNPCGIRTHMDSVLVFPRPKARFGTDRDGGCSPFKVSFSNKSVGKPTSYFWDFGNGQTSTLKDPPPINFVTDTVNKTYTITEVAINKYGSDTFRHIITVHPNSVKSFFNTNITSGCVPLAVQFTDFSKGSTFVSWDFGDSNVSALQNPVHVFSIPGVFTVKQFVNDGCGYDTGSILITVYPKPPVSFTAIPTCANDSMQFYNTSSNFSGCLWDFGDGTQSKLVNPKHAFSKPGNYSVILTIQSLSHGCLASQTNNVTVDTIPKADFSATPMEGCFPLNVKFSNTSTTATYFKWDFGDGNTSIDPSPTHLYKDSGIYTVSFSIVTRLGCTSDIQKQIVVFPYPVARFSISPNPVCGAPKSISFTNNSIGAKGYSWKFTNGKSSTDNSPNITFDSTGIYNATLVAINSYGCKDSMIQSFAIYPQPVAAFDAENTGCQSKSIRFINQSTFVAQFLWNFGDSTKDSTDQNPSHIYSFPGNYTVSLKVTGKGNCQDQVTKQNAVLIHPKPLADFTFQIEDNPLTGKVDFAADTNLVLNFRWYFGDQDSATGSSPRHQYDLPGTYAVKLITENAFGCFDTVEKVITIKYFEGFFVPNALSPGSGPKEEQIFLPKGASLSTYKLQIYTTWGELLWENSDLENGHPAKGWDGTSKGKMMPQGVYVWKISASFTNGQVWEGKDYNGVKKTIGSLTLIR